MMNVNSLYSGNIVTNSGAAVFYGQRFCDITNVETIFQDNTAPGEFGYGIIIIDDNGSLINNGSIFR